MRKILISINPEFVQKILDGTKKFEFRTKAAKQDIDAIIVYSTFPTKKVVAEVEILKVLKMSPEDLWEETSEFSGIERQFFDKYFENRTVAYAYKLGKITEYKSPKELKDFGVDFAPQSFIYLT